MRYCGQFDFWCIFDTHSRVWIFSGLDVFFTSFDDTFTVNVDPVSGIHDVAIDPKYRNETLGHVESLRKTRSVEDDLESQEEANATEPEKRYKYETQYATDFNSFLTLMEPNTFLLIKGVKNRLVITLPNDKHKLKVTRFYLVLYGVGSDTSNHTYGNVFFRQDQPHIDLFVFFSVFFSNFFLFLAICIVVWKMKQAFDARQTRHRRQLEMQHMASRPFAKADIIIEPDLCEFGPPPPPNLQQNEPTAKKGGTQTGQKPGSKHTSRVEPFSPLDDAPHVRHIALEPTDDGIAAVGTVFIQLPGGSCAPVRACLGSSLVQGSRVLLHTLPQQPKNTMYIRRRPSVTAWQPSDLVFSRHFRQRNIFWLCLCVCMSCMSRCLMWILIWGMHVRFAVHKLCNSQWIVAILVLPPGKYVFQRYCFQW